MPNALHGPISSEAAAALALVGLPAEPRAVAVDLGGADLDTLTSGQRAALRERIRETVRRFLEECRTPTL